MFPTRFFPGRYWAGQYWPKTGAAAALGDLNITGYGIAVRAAQVGVLAGAVGADQRAYRTGTLAGATTGMQRANKTGGGRG